MKILRYSLVLTFFGATAAGAQTGLIAERDPFYLHAAERSITEYIQPAFRQFEVSTNTLAQTLDDACGDWKADSPEVIGAAFRSVVQDFGRIEILTFGPLVEDNRFERLFFWPDRKGRALKQIQRVLAAQDPSVTDPHALAQKSVALQGLPGLDFLLYGNALSDLSDDPFRCSFAVAVSKNIHSISKTLRIEWERPDGFIEALLNPSSENALFRTPKETGREFFEVLVNGVERIKLLKLEAALGASVEKARPKRSAFWRSGLALALIRSNMMALSDFEQVAGFLTLLPSDKEWMINASRFEYKNAIGAIDQVDQPIIAAAADPGLHGKLSFAGVVMGNLQTLYEDQVGPVLGLRAGFNASDGD
ncbi:MAG: imelysin family protein [Pseudomonadota bacterium]